MTSEGLQSLQTPLPPPLRSPPTAISESARDYRVKIAETTLPGCCSSSSSRRANQLHGKQ